jgi:LysM repeat protein/predicted nucleic acid-binding Zn ribbon protein
LITLDSRKAKDHRKKKLKRNNNVKPYIVILIILTQSLFSCGQVKSSTSSNETKTQIVEQTEANFNQITNKAGIIFKEGLMAITDNRRSEAGEKFDDSVEVFLMSGVNVSRNQKLQNCYSQLIETVYRMEFPAGSQQPQIRSLSATCGWNWNDNDYKLADTVAKLVLTAPVETINNSALVTPASNNLSQSNNLQGFNEQKFEASPLEELAKLQISDAELKFILAPSYRTVRARKGDTVQSLSRREKTSAIAIARFNGLLISSTLAEGREVKVPKTFVNVIESTLGAKPSQSKDGRVQSVMDYYNENFNDPYSMRFVRWSDIEKIYYQNEPYWAVKVKFRAKNIFNAYILVEETYYIRKNKVVKTQRLN